MLGIGLLSAQLEIKKSLGFRVAAGDRVLVMMTIVFCSLQIVCSGYKAAFIDLDLAYCYKAPYGAGGLSSQLWPMEKGELDTYKRLRDERLISWSTFVGLSVFSMAKYIRRLVITKLARS